MLDTLAWLRRETHVWLEVTTLLIPGENDGEEELERAARWYREQLGPDVPWHFTAFHPDYRLRDRPGTPAATLTRARRTAQAAGIRYVYTGNVRDPAGGTTWCPQCGARLIGRDGYVLDAWGLRDGRCAACGCAVPGVFAAAPGPGVAGPQPVWLAEQP